MNTKAKTATEAAKQLNCAVGTVTRWAHIMKLGTKYGGSFVLTQEEIAKIKKAYQPNRGCLPK